jgi:hypothetical protein
MLSAYLCAAPTRPAPRDDVTANSRVRVKQCVTWSNEHSEKGKSRLNWYQIFQEPPNFLLDGLRREEVDRASV